MNARGLGNQIAVVLIAGMALVVAPLMRGVLPDQFLLDDAHLQDSIAGRLHTGDAEGFVVTAGAYRALGLAHLPSLAAILGIALFTVAVIAAIGWDRLRDLSLVGLAAVGASYVLALAYLAQYSKEAVTLLITLLVLLVPRARTRAGIVVGDLAVVAGCLLYAVTLREYWAIIAVLYLVWRVALAHVRRPALLLLVPVLAYIALTPAFQIVLGDGLQSQREWSNAERAGTADVASLIQSPFPGADGALGILSALISLVLLVVPVTLAASGSVYHLASAVLIVGIWALVLVPVARGRFAVPGLLSTRAARAASLLLAVLLVQALFEPDFGSYLKHLAPLLPLVLAVLPAASMMRPTDRDGDGVGGMGGQALDVDAPAIGAGRSAATAHSVPAAREHAPTRTVGAA